MTIREERLRVMDGKEKTMYDTGENSTLLLPYLSKLRTQAPLENCSIQIGCLYITLSVIFQMTVLQN